MRNLDWAIGLFEGEGTILIKKKPEYQLEVSLTSTDEDVVREFCRVINAGKVYGPYSYDSIRKPFWKWNLSNGTLVVPFLEKILPLLCTRRRLRAEEAINKWTERQGRPHYTVSRKGMGGRPRGSKNLSMGQNS